MAKATSRKSSESIPRSSMTWLSGEMFSRGMSQISEMMSATVSKVDAMTSWSFRRAQATYRLAGSLSTLGWRRCSRRQRSGRHEEFWLLLARMANDECPDVLSLNLLHDAQSLRAMALSPVPRERQRQARH